MIRWPIIGTIEKIEVKEEPGKITKVKRYKVDELTVPKKEVLLEHFNRFLEDTKKTEKIVSVNIEISATESFHENGARTIIRRIGFIF